MTIRAYLRENRAATTWHVAIVSAAVLHLEAAAGCSLSPHPTAANSTPKGSVTEAASTPPPVFGTVAAAAGGSVPLVAQPHNTATLLTRHVGVLIGTLTIQSASLKGKLTGVAKRSAAATWPGTRLRNVLPAYVTLTAHLKRKTPPDGPCWPSPSPQNMAGAYTTTTVSGGSYKMQFLAPGSTCELISS